MVPKIKLRNHCWSEIEKKVIKYYQTRYENFDPDMTKMENMNIISLLVDHNKKNGDSIKADDIAGLIKVFLGAGMDTSIQTTTSAIISMLNYCPDWVDRIRKDGIDSSDQLMSNASSIMAMKEA